MRLGAARPSDRPARRSSRWRRSGPRVVASAAATVRTDDRPNVIVVLTDDQRAGTFAAMPWLASQLARAGSGWAEFPNAFANTPLCCPARASLLTGLYARHTGVLDNGDGATGSTPPPRSPRGSTTRATARASWAST